VFVSPLRSSSQLAGPRTVEEGCVGRFACKCAAVGSIMQSLEWRVLLVGSSQLEALEQNVMLPRLLNIYRRRRDGFSPRKNKTSPRKFYHVYLKHPHRNPFVVIVDLVLKDSVPEALSCPLYPKPSLCQELINFGPS
jgi:hypothetical protein